MKDDRFRLLTDVVGALIDRAPIDWSGLRSRVRAPVDAHLVDTLRNLEAIRSQSSPSRVSERTRATVCAASIATVAAVQIAIGFFAVLQAAALGTGLGRLVPQLALALAFASAAAVLGSSRTRDGRRLFLLTTFLVVASRFLRGTMDSSAVGTEGPEVAEVFLRGLNLEAFIPACMWQFALDFPLVRRFTRFDIWGRRIAATMWLLGAAVVALNIVAAYGLMVNLGIVGILADTTGSTFWRALSVAVLPAIGVIFIRSRYAPYPERVKVARFALALVAGGLPFLILGVARTVVPAFDAWLLTAHARERFWLDLIVIVGLMASPILSTTAVIVDRPFELRATWWRFYRARSLSAKRLARSIERMTTACGPRETTFVLEREMRSGIGATRTRVMTPASDGGFIDLTGDLTPIDADAALHAIVEDETSTIDLSPAGPIVELLPLGDREWLMANDVALMAPLRRRTGDIAALVAIGPQRGGQPYGSDDHAFVTALGAAAGLAWDADRTRREMPRDQPAYECESCGLIEDAMAGPCACGGSLTLAAVPRRLGATFVVERRLGRGGAGVVYLARDVAIGREVALKTLPTLRRGIRTCLAEEARTMASLRHDGLATIYGLEIWREVPILVVEYFRDGTLARRLSAGPLSTSETIALGIALTTTLGYLHARGLLHRDLKPSNIALSTSGRPVVLDFGLATWLAPHCPADGRGIAGTPAYLPPEAFRHAPASQAFDLWALAVMLLECVAGTNPWASANRFEGVPRAPELALSAALLPIYEETPALASALERALDREVSQRFETAGDFRVALEAAR